MMNLIRSQLMAMAFMAMLGTASAETTAAHPQQWILATDDTELQLVVVDNQPVIRRLGVPGKSHNWLSGVAIAPSPDKTWQYVCGTYDRANGTLSLQFSKEQLHTTIYFQAQPGHGPIRQWSEIFNASDEAMSVSPPDSPLADPINPGAPAVIQWVSRGGNNALKQGGVFTEPLTGGLTKSLPMGQGGSNPIPWIAVQVEQQRGLYVAWEYPGRGKLQLHTDPNGSNLDIEFVLDEKQLPIAPGATLRFPPVLTGCYLGDMDEGSYCLHRYYLEKLRPSMPNGCPDPILVYSAFFGEDPKYFGLKGKDASLIQRHLELARDFGFEAFVVDAIWFDGFWENYKGPWIWDTKRFPNGAKPFKEFCRLNGMKFGLWCAWGHCFDQAKDITHAIVTENQLDYFKHDMNGLIPGGGYQGTIGYYKIQELLHKTFPDLILENCSSGGTIKDFGSMRRSHYVMTTDALDALPDRMGIYDSTFVFPPKVLLTYTWLRNSKPGPYLWRSGMMGAWAVGIPPLPDHKDSIQRAVQTYKDWIRPILQDCKVYHVFPRPDGKRWDGLFYWAPRIEKGILFVFRPDSDQSHQIVKLKGLEPNTEYSVWSEDGSIEPMSRTGKDLMNDGLKITMPTKYGSDLLFIQDGKLVLQR